MPTQNKILSIKISGVSTFLDDTFSINFVNKQNASNIGDNEIFSIFSSVFLSTAMGITGINASGKTTILRLIRFVMDFVSGQSDSRGSAYESLFGIFKEEIVLECFFFNAISVNRIFFLQSKLRIRDGKRLVVEDEKLCFRDVISTTSRSNLFDTEMYSRFLMRDQIRKLLEGNTESKNNNLKFNIPDDVSICRFFYIVPSQWFFSIDSAAISGESRLPDEIVPEAVEYLDESIEYLRNVPSKDNEPLIELKFKACDHQSLISSDSLPQYLSSGTIRGLRIFSLVRRCLAQGGYFLIDEIETSLHRSLVTDVIQLFTSKQSNPNNATLIFTTHTPEVLDSLRRNDSVFVTEKSERSSPKGCGAIELKNLSEYLPRNDLKKSEAIMGAINGLGSLPDYDKFSKLQKAITKYSLKKGE